jgi:ABC-2 type transport system ATP-binding protein
MEWVVERTGLGPMLRRPIRELSKGYLQRTALAQALIHDPEIVILDEPTSGLDPHQILEIRRLIRELASRKTVIFSTHILREVEAIAQRVVIINEGRIVAEGTIKELCRAAQGEGCVVMKVKGGPEGMEEAVRALPAVTGVTLQTEGQFVILTISCNDVEALCDGLWSLAQQRGWQVMELSERAVTLEEAFLALTEVHMDEGLKGGSA